MEQPNIWTNTPGQWEGIRVTFHCNKRSRRQEGNLRLHLCNRILPQTHSGATVLLKNVKLSSTHTRSQAYLKQNLFENEKLRQTPTNREEDDILSNPQVPYCHNHTLTYIIVPLDHKLSTAATSSWQSVAMPYHNSKHGCKYNSVKKKNNKPFQFSNLSLKSRMEALLLVEVRFLLHRQTQKQSRIHRLSKDSGQLSFIHVAKLSWEFTDMTLNGTISWLKRYLLCLRGHVAFI